MAVLAAEKVTSRFLNVMGLFAGSIPLVAIQLNALKVGDQLVLDFVTVLDQRALRVDDTIVDVGTDVDRAYWEARVGPEVLQICDRVLGMINETADPQQQLNYKKQYIGLTSGASARNFVALVPKKRFLHLQARVADVDGWIERLEDEEGLAAESHRAGVLRVTLKPTDFSEHEPLIQGVGRASRRRISSLKRGRAR